jgi:hypothetical protein
VTILWRECAYVKRRRGRIVSGLQIAHLNSLDSIGLCLNCSFPFIQ